MKRFDLIFLGIFTATMLLILASFSERSRYTAEKNEADKATITNVYDVLIYRSR